jgi:hypothetical protein
MAAEVYFRGSLVGCLRVPAARGPGKDGAGSTGVVLPVWNRAISPSFGRIRTSAVPIDGWPDATSPSTRSNQTRGWVMTGRNTTVAGVALLGMLLVASIAVTQPTDPWVGTWKANLPKSKFNPGPPPKSFTLRIEPVAGGSQKQTFDGVNAEGQTTHYVSVYRV